ncbi:MAG: transporter [Clostridium sp.]|nr:transporter [Clostridium sp.]
MKDEFSKIFQVAVVFIGTIVGAGLASGQEIKEFFTSYGVLSFLGIIVCGIFYIILGSIVSKISIKYKLNSYGDVIKIVSPNILGKITGLITTLYLISSASIILAGSGALINQFFGVPKIIGSLIMIALAIFFLLKDTDGLIQVNSFIVPTLIITISIITILYFLLCKDLTTIHQLVKFEPTKSGITLSTILYAGYNTLCCLGVLVPLSNQIKKPKTMFWGITLGALGLVLLSFAINFLLMINEPYIHNYEIPLLFVAQRFGNIIQALLLIVIWLEMFSTEVSDIFSISKTIDNTFHIEFKKAIFIVILIALPISRIGFSKLIGSLYPIFGLLSLIFIVQTIYFYYKHKKNLN